MTLSEALALVPRRRARAEDGLQEQVVEFIRLVVPDATVIMIPNAGKRSKQEGARLKRMGLLPGAADLEIVLPGGTAYFIELKTADGRLSKDQKDFRINCINRAIPYCVCRNLDDVRTALAVWRISTREALAP
jgi:hypothetical protein